MIVPYRFFLSILLASNLAKVADASLHVLGRSQDDETPGGLRGRTHNSDIIGRKIQVKTLSVDKQKAPNGSDRVIDSNKVQHVVIKCKEGEDSFLCKKRILAAIPTDSKDRFKITNYLKLINSYAAEVKGDVSVLYFLDGDVYDDPPRESMHIKESLRVHRNLTWKNGQQVPYGVKLVQAMDVWEKHNTKGENVRICVLDTGVDGSHPDFETHGILGYDGNELIQPWWKDSSGHGTHVTGTIAASDNNQGVVGVAPGVEIFTARIFAADEEYYSSNIIAALQACVEGGAQVVSMSLGGTTYLSYENQAFRDLHEKFGIVSVASAGNDGENLMKYPAAYDKVISVASVDSNGDISPSSTWNEKVDVAAPGVDIFSTYDNGDYATLSGTSMAVPHVSGIVALMLSSKPNATPAQIFTALENTSVNPNTSGRDDHMGHGLVNALSAVEEILKCPDEQVDRVNVYGDDDAEGGNMACTEVVVTLHTDRYACETSHWLSSTTTSGDEKFLFYEDTFESFETYQETACVDRSACTKYNIRDSFGDGISGAGVEVKFDGEIIYSGGRFDAGGEVLLGKC